MRFLVDECLSRTLVDELRNAGHDVRFMREEGRGADDRSVLSRAFVEGRIVITEDADFGLLVVRERNPSIGVLLVAASAFGWSPPQLAAHVVAVVATLADQLNGMFTRIEPGRIRQRKIDLD